jgi:hypothetical protein
MTSVTFRPTSLQQNAGAIALVSLGPLAACLLSARLFATTLRWLESDPLVGAGPRTFLQDESGINGSGKCGGLPGVNVSEATPSHLI